MKLKISQESAQQLQAMMPGIDIANLRLVRFSAKVQTPDSLSVEEQALVASEVQRAGGPPMVSNGVPTIMRMVAWMCHEGRNDNGLIFEADDLGPAADKIREPNFILMDWNHSAVLPWSMEPKVVGTWYKAEKRWDPQALDGKGAYGILAHGIMWSWAFPDIADEMLAMQERNGHLDFSMACLPTTVTLAENGEIAHQPVFLTLSGLNVRPADKDATGLGKEGSDDPMLEQNLSRELTQTHFAAPTLEAAAAQEESMADQNKTQEALEQQIAALNAEVASLKAKLAEKEPDGDEHGDEDYDSVQLLVTKTIQAKEELETKVTELTVANEALVSDAATLKAQAEDLQAKLTEATAKLDAIAAAEADRAKTARYDARIASLPKTYVKKLEARSEEERSRFAKKWTDASDEDFNEFKAEIETAFQGVQLASSATERPDYLRISQEEGVLPTGGEGATDEIAGILASIKK